MGHHVEPLDSTDPGAVGPYRLLARLGAGGMGLVYLARSAGGRTVAVKVVRPELAQDAEFRARFRREVAAAQAVEGAYTAPVVDADRDGPVPWLATAYVLGPSLTDAVGAHGPLPEASVRALGAGLAQALAAVHAAGLVHRDLKPSNVLLAADGPRVIDFGIARALDGDSMTRTGIVVGSPGFMCPEQASGKPMGPAGDVFSLGAVLVYAATGHGPFESESGAAAQLYKVVHDQPELDALPASLRPVVAACLAKDPSRRPSPDQVAGMLVPGGVGAALRDGWLPAPVASALAQHAALVMDMETPARGTVAPSLAGHPPTSTDAAAAADPGTMQLGRAAAGPTEAVQNRPTSRRGFLIGGAVAAAAAVGGGTWILTGPSGKKPVVTPTTSPTVQPAPVQSRPDGVPPQPIWTYNAQGRLAPEPPLVSGGLVFPRAEALVALDGATGTEKWSRPDVNGGSIALAGGQLFAHLDGIQAFDQATGVPRWQTPDRSADGRTISLSDLLGADEHTVYAMGDLVGADFTGTNGVFGFSVATHQQLWFQPRKEGASPLVQGLAAGGNVYYTDADTNFVARSGQDGHQMWFATVGQFGSQEATADADQVYCALNNTGLQAVRISDGKQQWALTIPQGQTGGYTPVLVTGGTLYTSDSSESISAYDPKTGKVLWTCPLPGRPSSMTPPVLVKDTLFVPGPTRNGIYAVDTKHAKVRWTFQSAQGGLDDWYLATDGERLFAQLGPHIYALPPV